MIKQALKAALLRAYNSLRNRQPLDVNKLPYVENNMTSPAKYDAGVYGDKRDAEYAKVDAYNKAKNIPYRTRNKHIPVQIGTADYHVKHPTTVPNISRDEYGDSWSFISDTGTITVPKYFKARKTQGPRVNGFHDQDRRTIDGTAGHELAHAWTVPTVEAIHELKERIRAELPKDQQPRFPLRLGPQPYGAMSEPDIYPEQNTTEFIPPLEALQKHLYTTTGSRLETPEAFDKYMESTGLNELHGKAFEARMNELGLPLEAKRLFRYYNTLREYSTPERLQNYHNINRKFIPGIVQTLGRQLGQNQAHA